MKRGFRLGPVHALLLLSAACRAELGIEGYHSAPAHVETHDMRVREPSIQNKPRMKHSAPVGCLIRKNKAPRQKQREKAREAESKTYIQLTGENTLSTGSWYTDVRVCGSSNVAHLEVPFRPGPNSGTAHTLQLYLAPL